MVDWVPVEDMFVILIYWVYNLGLIYIFLFIILLVIMVLILYIGKSTYNYTLFRDNFLL